MVSKYLRYCRLHKSYEGPVNWVSPINFETGEWSPPPDYLEFLERKQEIMAVHYDGGSPSPESYLEKYMNKFIGVAERVSQDLGDGLIDSETIGLLNLKFLMYWVTGLPFYYCDRKVYRELGLSRYKPPPRYEFIGVFERDLVEVFIEGYPMS